MSKSVLLINPWIYDFSAYDYWMKPLGLLYMASYLRKNGVGVRLIDCLTPPADADPSCRIPKRKPGGHGKFPTEAIATPAVLAHISKPYHRYGMSLALFDQMLQKEPVPDAVLVTAMMTYWYPGAFDVIDLVKRRFPHAPVILGGNYATLCPEHARTSGADYVLTGAGEEHIPSIITEILGEPLRYLPDAGRPEALPYPAFDLLKAPDQLPILTSRGCPFRCTYCASHLLYGGFRRRDPGAVADELAFWTGKLGVTDYSFYDDALLVRPEELAIPLMREIIRRAMSLRFHCPNGLHLREVTPDIATLMFQSGFRTLRFGFETSNLERQSDLGGKAFNTHLEACVAYLHEAGYTAEDIGVYILCGLPGQTADEVRATILYVCAQGARPILAEFSPIPGTVVWPEAVAATTLPIAEEPLFHNNSLLPCRSADFSLQDYQQLKALTRTAPTMAK